MSEPGFEVWLDEERQIIRERIYREPDLEDFRQMMVQARECAKRLRRPNEVRILIDGNWRGRMKKPLRQEAVAVMRDPDLVRLAIVNSNPMARIMIRFLRAATGLKVVQAFYREDEAMRWLLS